MEPFLLDGRPDLTCKDSTTQASYRPRVEAVMALDGACGRSHSDARVGCGELVGANPTDRGKSGSKYHLIVDGAGLPLAALVSAANTHDSRLLVPLVDRVGPVRGRVGRPRRRPARLYADKAYDFGRCRRALRARGITARIARRGVQSARRLGRHRWKVERTIAWLLQHRRLQVRYERLAAVLEGLLQLACALMCWRSLRILRGGRGVPEVSSSCCRLILMD